VIQAGRERCVHQDLAPSWRRMFSFQRSSGSGDRVVHLSDAGASQAPGTSSRAGIASSRSVVRPVDLLPPLDYLRSFRQTCRPLNYHSANQPRNPMRIASHIATALSAATGRFDRPSDRPLVGAFGYWGTPSNTSEQGSRPKPE